MRLDIWVELADPPASLNTRGIEIQPAGPVSRWKIGDTIRIGMGASGDCHIALLNIGPSGNVTCLVPNTYRPGFSARENDVFFFPSQADDFRFTLTGPAGRERLVALATHDPIHISLPLLTRMASGAGGPADVFELLSSGTVQTHASVDFDVFDPAANTRSIGAAVAGRSDQGWRAFDLT